MRLYGRQATVTVSRTFPGTTPGFGYANPQAFDFSRRVVIGQSFRINFTIEKGLAKDPNKCDITIYNLNDRTRDEMDEKPLSIQLHAGYDGELRLLFAGEAIHAASKLVDTEWQTLLQVGDGMRAYKHAVTELKSYKKGTTYRTVLRDVVRTMGLTIPKHLENDPRLDRQFASGHATDAPSRDELTTLLAPFGFSWSVQNGELVILSDDQVRDGTEVLVNAAKGMIGVPEFGTPDKSKKPPTLTTKAALYPQIEPGRVARIETAKNKAANGRFKIGKVKHTGDTDEGSWETEFESTPAAA